MKEVDNVHLCIWSEMCGIHREDNTLKIRGKWRCRREELTCSCTTGRCRVTCISGRVVSHAQWVAVLTGITCTTGRCRDRDSDPGSHNCVPSTLPTSLRAISSNGTEIYSTFLFSSRYINLEIIRMYSVVCVVLVIN